MHYLMRAGYGLLLWMIMFMWVTILMFGFKMQSGIVMNVLAWVVSLIAVWYLSGFAKVKNLSDGIITGIIFALIGILMDWFITAKFSPGILSSWSIWVSYGLVVIVAGLRGSIKPIKK